MRQCLACLASSIRDGDITIRVREVGGVPLVCVCAFYEHLAFIATKMGNDIFEKTIDAWLQCRIISIRHCCALIDKKLIQVEIFQKI